MESARRTLAGRYQLGEVIGRGGMGTVYRATDRVLGRPVAVKVLPGALADQDPTSVARFQREARAAAALSHPAVVAVYDAGADQASRFIVMELIDGRSLEAILRDEGRLAPARVAAIGAQVAGALAAAHAAGIVHRDVKPANVMVAHDGSIKVLDFGIARAVDGTTLTQNASVIGTAAYMSPEQALGKPADERSDIYSLGCVLYALLAGQPPFSGDSAAAILNQQATVAPRPLRRTNGRIPPALDGLVMQMLAKSPDDRPQTAAQVRDRLSSSGGAAAARPPVTAPTARLGETAVTRALPRRAHAERRWLIVAGAVAALVLVIAVVALALGGSSPRAGSTVRRDTTAAKRPHTTPATTPAAATGTPTTTTTAPAKPPTVSAAAGSLTALITQDVQSGRIDQQAAQQIGNGLTNVLTQYETGNTANAQQQLSKLSKPLEMLEQHGDVTSAAAPALNAAIANLGTALAHAPAPTTQTHGPQPSGPPAPPGQGGQPPGQAKHKGPHGH